MSTGGVSLLQEAMRSLVQKPCVVQLWILVLRQRAGALQAPAEC